MAAKVGSGFEPHVCLAAGSKVFGRKVGGSCLLLQVLLGDVDCDVGWTLFMVVLGCVAGIGVVDKSLACRTSMESFYALPV